MAEAAVPTGFFARAQFRAALRAKAREGNAAEKKACAGVLAKDALFEDAFDGLYHTYSSQHGGRLADWWKWIKDNWATILQYLMSLLMLI